MYSAQKSNEMICNCPQETKNSEKVALNTSFFIRYIMSLNTGN